MSSLLLGIPILLGARLSWWVQDHIMRNGWVHLLKELDGQQGAGFAWFIYVPPFTLLPWPSLIDTTHV